MSALMGLIGGEQVQHGGYLQKASAKLMHAE
jgi:hypothetical protein